MDKICFLINVVSMVADGTKQIESYVIKGVVIKMMVDNSIQDDPGIDDEIFIVLN